jgi:hypothetical protein
MPGKKIILFAFALILFFAGCRKKDNNDGIASGTALSFTVNNVYNGTLNYTGLGTNPTVKFSFTDPINPATVTAGIKLTLTSGAPVNATTSLEDGNKTLIVKPAASLVAFTNYILTANDNIRSAAGGNLVNPVSINLRTGRDSSDKFPIITDSALLTLVQKQTFKYFWDFGHSISGLARERNTSGETVTMGGSGFGIMAIIAGIKREFVTRPEGFARLQKIVDFLKVKAQKFHGAFPHWMNGTTGAVIPFNTMDNGADLVETAFLMQGLLTARQYFDGGAADETTLRTDITTLFNNVEWDWFRQGTQNVLYWHWSPNYGFQINLPIGGWNETLMVYVLAASSTTHSIPKIVYDNGFAKNGAIRNGSTYYGTQLPLGPNLGGPLFFSHYSFLGINPNGLTDAYASYEAQNKAHALINYTYCKTNPKGYYGYSTDCWGLTSSDAQAGYTASSPTNDIGVIAPTAAISSLPYTPDQSMRALRFFYYKLGDKLWGQYGFYDAFNLSTPWFATSYLAIDQGPIIVMIENYRSAMLWNLFTSCPEVKQGMRNLGFQSPYL